MNRQRIWKIVGVLVLLAVLAIVYLDYRYSFIFPCPRVPGDTVAPPRSSFRMQIQPARLSNYIARHYTQDMHIPEWLLGKILPYEVSIFMDPDITQATNNVVVYANEQRLGPVLVQAVNRANVLAHIPDVTWNPPELLRERRGVVRLQGSMPIASSNINILREVWGIVSPLSPIPMKNEHAVEALLDLRDGRGFLLLADWVGRNAPPGSKLHPDQIVPIAKNIATAWVSANLQGDETLQVQVVIECRPEASESDANSTGFLLNYVTAELNRTLKRVCDVELSGTAEAQGIQVIGNYTLAPLDRLLRTMGLMR